jgi:hypothetical protein
MKLVEEIVKLAPVYYVTGNHEWRSGRFSSLEERLKSSGVKVLRNEAKVITEGSLKIINVGIDDPMFNVDRGTEDNLERALGGSDEDKFRLLLAHSPELFGLYSDKGVDLIFSGHAHGGQFRIPFIGGLLAPNQGSFPKYSAVKYQQGKSTMIVSRGLGNSLFPQRLFNRPEVMVVRLVKSKN